ncbi:hypothetical protein V3C99_017908 [Haemonchus contortus]
MILPNDFRARSSAFSEGPDVECRLYGTLNDIGTLLESSAACICVLVGPTTDELIAKCEWYELATSLATAARTEQCVMSSSDRIQNTSAQSLSTEPTLMEDDSAIASGAGDHPSPPNATASRTDTTSSTSSDNGTIKASPREFFDFNLDHALWAAPPFLGKQTSSLNPQSWNVYHYNRMARKHTRTIIFNIGNNTVVTHTLPF